MNMSNTNNPAEMLEQINTAITAVLSGGQSYKIGSRSRTFPRSRPCGQNWRRRSPQAKPPPCWIAPMWRSLTGGDRHGSH